MSKVKKSNLGKAAKEAKKMKELRLKESIIEKMREHPFLYAKELKDFKNVARKDKQLEEIAKELQITVKDVKAKMKYLRDGYVREKKSRETEATSGASSSKRTPFPFFDQMAFIEPYIRKRNSLYTLDAPENETSQQESDDESNGDGDVDEVIARTQDAVNGLYDDVEDDLNPDSPSTQVAITEVLQLERQISEEWEAEKAAEKAAENAKRSLFPVAEEPPRKIPRKSPRKTPSKSPRKTPSKSPSKLTQNLTNSSKIGNTSSKVSPKKSKSPGQSPSKSVKASPTKKKDEKKPFSQSVSNSLPILEGKPEDIRDKRSRMKKEAELTADIKKVVSALSEAKDGESESTTPESLLVKRIHLSLTEVSDKRERLRWRRKFENILNDLEEYLLDKHD